MKIVYISPNGYLGGAENLVLKIANFHSSQQKSSVLFFSDGEAVTKAKKLGIQNHILKKKFRLSRPLSLIAALLEIRQFIKIQKPDIIHSTMPYSHLVISLACFGLKLKKVWFQHGPVGGILDTVGNLFFANMIWYNSHDLLKRHHQSLTTPKTNKEVVIKIGVGEISSERKILNNDVIQIGSAGRITPWKGINQVIEALSLIKNEKSKKTFYYKIAGSPKTLADQKYFIDLQQLVRAYNLQDKVIFLDHVDDMTTFYKGLDVFVHSSTIPEPFGLVVAEAMLSSSLVIGSNNGGVTEFLKNNKTGICFSSTDKKGVFELAQIFREILNASENEKEKYLNIAKEGQKYILENHSMQKMKNQIENLYQELMDGDK